MGRERDLVCFERPRLHPSNLGGLGPHWTVLRAHLRQELGGALWGAGIELGSVYAGPDHI